MESTCKDCKTKESECKDDLVSVLMPIFNSEAWVATSLNSILKQTYSNIEIVLVDDGSSDKSLIEANDTWTKYKPQMEENGSHRSFKIVRFDSNQGIVKALNCGLSQCQSGLVIRMDADDVAELNKIELQLDTLVKCRKLLEETGNVIQIIGTGVQTFKTDKDENKCDLKSIVYDCGCIDLDSIRDINAPEEKVSDKSEISVCNPLCLKWNMLFFCALNHPTVMLDIDAIKRGMSKDDKNDKDDKDDVSDLYQSSDATQHCEDYALWFRLLFDNNCNAININQSLLKLRKHGSNVSSTSQISGNLQRKHSLQLRTKYIAKLLDISEKQVSNEDDINSILNEFERDLRVLGQYVEYVARPERMKYSKEFRTSWKLIEKMEKCFCDKFASETSGATTLPKKWIKEGKAWIKNDCDKRLAQIMTMCFQIDFVTGLQLRSKWKARDPSKELQQKATLI